MALEGRVSFAVRRYGLKTLHILTVPK